MEEQEKQTVLGNLYALRAGLSKISEEADKIPAAEEKAERELAKLSDEATGGRENIVFCGESNSNGSPHTAYAFVNCVSTAETIEFVKKEMRKERQSLIAVAETEDKRRGPCEGDYSAKERRAKAAYAKWLGTAGAKNYYENLCSHYKWEHSGCKKTAVVWGVIAIVTLIATVIFSLLISSNTAFSAGAGLCGIAMLVSGFIACVYLVIYKSDDKKRKELNGYLRSIGDCYGECSQRISQELDVSLRQVKTTYEKLYSVLEKEYSALLDPRDWKYVDLVIFYFETGRAETMKEALQLVEREVQTQRIVGAIEMASERVCRTITTAAVVISTQLNVISAQLGTVVRQQEIQNALLAKANTTSEQLMSDAQFIKRYAI